MFKVLAKDGAAKYGRFETVHGTIETPVFMNVGTAGAIKGAVAAEDLKEIKTQVELSNTYHLHVRPGDKIVKQLGGLHRFMNWDKPILTDSGGFQVFSLAGLRLGWIATHDMSVVKSCLSHRDYNLVSCGVFDEMLAAAALKHRDKLLDRSRKIVRENLQILDDWVGSEPHVSYVKPKAGTTALVYYDLDISSYEFCEEMYKKTGAFVTPGDCFEVPHSMRIGYAYGKQHRSALFLPGAWNIVLVL